MGLFSASVATSETKLFKTGSAIAILETVETYRMNVFSLITTIMLSQGVISMDTDAHVLPLNAEKVDKVVILTWTPSAEPGTSHFEIQRSNDGRNWKAVGIMFPYEDNQEHSYTFPDKSLKRQHAYYRIRQVDTSKKECFSETKHVGRNARH